jgi:hypothetical protein
MLFLMMVLDGLSPPIGLKSVTAQVNHSDIVMEGFFDAGNATPLLVWPKSTQWFNPCSKAKDLCCLMDVNRNYRNDVLKRFQGPNCLTSLPSADMVAGSRENVQATKSTFKATIPVNTPFVAMLFIHHNPFFVMDGFQEVKITYASKSSSTLVLNNNPCHNVVVPGTLAAVCMQCNNPLPLNAYYIWTPSWYNDYRCMWECKSSYTRNGDTCEQGSKGVPLQGAILGIVVAIVLLLFYILARRTLKTKPIPAVVVDKPGSTEPQFKKEFIAFKDTSVQLEVRFKTL